MNFLIPGKDKTPITRQSGVYQIPCECGKYYIGKSHQNSENHLQQHKDDITKALNSNIANVSFDSALTRHVFENSSHKILFEESAIISNDLGIKQVAREAIEIRLKIDNDVSLNRGQE